MYKIAIAIFALLLFSSCFQARIAGECPEMVNLKCLTRRVCGENKERGCQVCTCEGAMIFDPAAPEKVFRGKEQP